MSCGIAQTLTNAFITVFLSKSFSMIHQPEIFSHPAFKTLLGTAVLQAAKIGAI